MIDDSVDIDAYAYTVTSLHHIYEGRLVAATAVEKIRDGLVAFPPRAPSNNRMFVRRRYLDAAVPSWPEEFLAFSGDIGPGPFEEMNEHS